MALCITSLTGKDGIFTFLQNLWLQQNNCTLCNQKVTLEVENTVNEHHIQCI
jgi:hypothetical protein